MRLTTVFILLMTLGIAGMASVPISPDSDLYAKRTEIRFGVCDQALTTGAIGATGMWNAVLAANKIPVKFVLETNDCQHTFKLGDGISNIYFSNACVNKSAWSATAAYAVFFSPERITIKEEDVCFRTNVRVDHIHDLMVHELGHSIGLLDNRFDTCQTSIMHTPVCTSKPQQLDIDAVKRIYLPEPDDRFHGYDLDESGDLSDPEFFLAIDDWISEMISDVVFFELLDAWIGGA